MGTNGNNDDFDSISIDFFRQGEEGDDAFWDDDSDEAPSAEPVSGPDESALTDAAASTDAPATDSAEAEADAAPDAVAPPSVPAAPSQEVTDVPPSMVDTIAPETTARDRALFSAPTIIVPAGEALFADEPDSHEIASATPPAPEPPAPEPVAAVHEETLFDADSALNDSTPDASQEAQPQGESEPYSAVENDVFGDLGGAEETLEVFDAPTQEAPRSLVEELLADAAPDPVADTQPAATADEYASSGDPEEDGEDFEASAEDFEDMAEHEQSLVMRRSATSAQEEPSTEPAPPDASASDDLLAAPAPPPVPAPGERSGSEPDAAPAPPVPADSTEPPEPEPDAMGDAGASLEGAPAAAAHDESGIASELHALSTRPAESTGEAWEEVLVRLEGLAERADEASRAGFAAEAGRVAIEHAGDAARAEQLLARAAAAGGEDAGLLAAYSIAVGALGDHARLRDLLVRRGELLGGAAGADLLQDAALVERHQLGREQAAVQLLERSFETGADDPTAQWFGLQLLRDLHTATGNWSAAADAIAQMATISAPGEASPYWMALGAIREEHLEDWSGALTAYMHAVDDGSADPQAFVGAERCASRAGDPATLATLFGRIIEQSSGADAGFWKVRQARALQSTGEASAAIEAWQAALQLSLPPTLRHEAFAALSNAGEWQALHAALREESERADGMGRTWARTWAADIAEIQLDDSDGAVADLQDALAAGSSAPMVRERLVRLLVTADRSTEAADHLEQMIQDEADPNRLLALHFRLAEIHERTLGDIDRARVHYESVLGISPAYLPALDGLERCATAAGDWASVVGVHEQRALVQHAPNLSAGHLVAAAQACERSPDAAEQALGLYQRAFESVPGDPVALDGVVRLAEQLGRTAVVVNALQAAAASTDNETLRVSFLYRLAAILLQDSGDIDAAQQALAQCVELAPAFRPAASALMNLARSKGDWAQCATMQAAAASAASGSPEQVDLLVEAARSARRGNDPRVSEFIQEALRLDRQHPGARMEADLHAIQTGDLNIRRTLMEQSLLEDRTAPSYTVLSDFCAALGDREGASAALDAAVVHGGAEQTPRFLAALAVRLGNWDHAVALVESFGDWVSSGTIHSQRREDPDAAQAAWAKSEDSTAAASGLIRLAGMRSDREAMEAAHRQLAMHTATAGRRGLNAVFAGRLAAARGDTEAATAAYRLGLGETPGRGRVMDGLIRVLVDAKDADGLSDLLGHVDETWPGEHAELLAEAGAHTDAAAAFQALASDEAGDSARRVGLWIRAERSLMEVEDWRGVLDCLRAQCDLIDDEPTRADLAARQRWILAEKLADSDDAWEQYQALHASDPDNAEVLEALARIAGARGLVDQAIEYLEALSEIAGDATDAARYRRRIAEVHLAAANPEAAKVELSKSIELNPSDAETLKALREVAEQQEDWNAMVGVLSREANVMEGDARTARLRQIAGIWEDQIADPAVAMDAWRKVLHAVPEDSDALSHLVSLSRQTEDWSTFAEAARSRVGQLADAERTALEAELGVVLLRQLYNEEEAVQHLETASRGDFAQVDAAMELERIYLSAGLWDKAIEVMLRRADASENDERVSCLLRAAQTCLEMTGNQETTSSIYAKVLETAPDNTTALRFQADHLFNAGDMASAAVVFERLEADFDQLDIDEEDEDDVLEIALSLFRFGQVLEQLGRGEEAILRYEKVGEINPAHLPSLEAVGPLYIEAGEWKKAGKAFRQILRLTSGQGDPARLARTYTSIGRVELELGNLDKAERRFAKALQVRPNDISALTGSADVLLRRGDTQTGEQRSDTWRRLLTVYNSIIYHAQTPEEVVFAYLTKGFVLDARLDLADKAAQHYRKSLAFDGAQPQVLLRLAEHALRRQDWPEAESLATQGLALETVSAEHRAGLHLVRYCAFSSCGDAQAASDELAAAQATEVALAVDLGDADPGAAVVHEALRARLSERL